MLDDQDIYRDLSFSADDGWAEMQILLNGRMPQSKKNIMFRSAIGLLPVVMLSILFTIACLQLNRYNFPFYTAYSSLLPMAEEDSSIQEPGAGNIAGTKIIDNSSSAENKIRDVIVSLNTHDLTVASAGRVETGDILRSVPINELGNGAAEIHIPEPAIGFPSTAPAGEKKQRVKRWEFSAGTGVNVAAGKQQNLQPYPVAAVKFNLSPKFFVAGGVSLFSPAPATVSGVSRMIHVNDTMNNIRLYKQVTEHYQLRYADMPLYVGINLSNSISLQAGMQASLLLSKSERKSLYQYDFRMNSSDSPAIPFAGTAAGPQEEFDVLVRKIDYRFVTAVKYQYKKITAGLIYQHGLRPPAAGNSTGNKNQVFTLSMLYNIK